MARKYAGTYPLNDSKTKWGFRIKKMLPNGQMVDTSRKEWPKGVTFSTAKEASDARTKFWNHLVAECENDNKNSETITLGDVFNMYIESPEAKNKAPNTIRKHKSVWVNHIEKRFGNVLLSEISVQDMSNYLIEVYHDMNYSYGYVEGFLKVFYLLFGYAYRSNKIGDDAYQKMFVNKEFRLAMPKKKQEDAEKEKEAVKVYNEWELYQMEKVLTDSDSPILTAFLIARYAGLRISEVFALRYDDIDYHKSTIKVNRQMDIVNGELRLCEVKTLQSSRTVIIPEILRNHLVEKQNKQWAQERKMGMAYKNTERVYDAVSRKYITGGNFVNRKNNGELLTESSVKYWVKEIEEKTGVHLRFHLLRHTYATECAANNMNHIMLMDFMGHKKIDTTLQYYISTKNKKMLSDTKELLEKMYCKKETIPENPKGREMIENILAVNPSFVHYSEEEVDKFAKHINKTNSRPPINFNPPRQGKIIGTGKDTIK